VALSHIILHLVGNALIFLGQDTFQCSHTLISNR
jgi:hypothetical protein